MKYADNIDYLVSSIMYLGSHSYFWARTPDNMASELALDATRLEAVFDAFPGLFRKSQTRAQNGQPFYALQARYALRKGGDTKEPNQISSIETLSTERLQLLVDFVVKMSEQETAAAENARTNRTAVMAAVISAGAAIVSAGIAVFLAST